MAVLTAVMAGVRESGKGPAQVSEKQPGLLVVLGKNWSRDRRRLSVESRLNAVAAIELYRRGVAVEILFSGGHTAGARHPSEAAEMAGLARTLAPSAPSEALLLEEKSIDTAANAQHVRVMLNRMEPRPVYLLTTSNHLPAAVRIFEAHSVPVSAAFKSEDVVHGRSAHYASLLNRYRRSPRVRMDRMRERLRMVLLGVDPRARTLRPLTTLLRRSMQWSSAGGPGVTAPPPDVQFTVRDPAGNAMDVYQQPGLQEAEDGS